MGIVIIVFIGLTPVASARADEPDLAVTLPEVTVTPERPVAASSEAIIPDKEILLQPQGRPANLLRLVPGLVTLEHSGGAGKADQYLLRGFDADHGTDLALHLDNMPVNLRSHAHGQGYADLNFIIPETIERIDVFKGPYYVRYGDFATAGAVNYVTREVAPENVVQAAGGQFNTQRHLVMASPTREEVRTLVAVEGYYTDGPFIHVNRNTRFNGLAKATMNPTPRSRASLTLTQHYGRWNGSGQIPLREVRAGRLDRFGSIDPSEGGETLRSTARLDVQYDWPSGGTAYANLYGQYVSLDLFSNFTFFLNDPVNGDGFEQNDRRWLYGGDVGYRQMVRLLDVDSLVSIGVQARVDDAHVRLGTQRKRTALGITQESTILEASYSPYLQVDLQPVPWLRFAGGVRADVFTFDVEDRCGATCAERPEGHTSDVIASPKGSLILGPWLETEWFLNVGTGFHSNDARAVVGMPDVDTLPRATGYEVGLRSKPWEWAQFVATLWLLDLESELVFVGDEGTTEIRGPSRRYGAEIGTRLNPWEWLQVNGSVTYTEAEFRKTGEAIPLAPELTARGSITGRWPFGLAASLQMLTVGSRPATEDRRVLLEPFTIFDLMLRQRLPVSPPAGRLEAFMSIRNLTDTKWRQAQFFFESRLPSEPTPVADIHFVPGIPRMVMGGLSWYFE